MNPTQPGVRYSISGTVHYQSEDVEQGVSERPQFDLYVAWAGYDEPEAAQALKALRAAFPNSSLGLTKFTEHGEAVYVPRESGA